MPLHFNCDRDDVDILYVLETHGWSTCILYIGDTTHSIDSISHAFGDPMGDLVSATISLLKGASAVEFIWWHEPGETLEETMANIQEARELWIETAYEMGDPIPLPNNAIEYSGKFLLRMPKSLHRDLVQKAEAEAVSLNHYISSVLSRSVN